MKVTSGSGSVQVMLSHCCLLTPPGCSPPDPSSCTQNYFLCAAWTRPCTADISADSSQPERTGTARLLLDVWFCWTMLHLDLFPIMLCCRLTVLALKHFEGSVESDQLISSYLLCKSRWNIRKRIREMSGPRAPQDSVIKVVTSSHLCDVTRR